MIDTLGIFLISSLPTVALVHPVARHMDVILWLSLSILAVALINAP